jgi:transcription elongation GreA/GreB family factor
MTDVARAKPAMYTLSMQIPQRRSQINRIRDAESLSRELTPESLERLKRTLNTLEKVERPRIVVDLSHALTLGDFSENAEYQDAKHRLSRIDGRIFGLKERIKQAVIIPTGSDNGKIRMGSTVTIKMNGKIREYRILGPQEANPLRGNISHQSPLGAALIGHQAGETVEYKNPDGQISYVEIQSVD